MPQLAHPRARRGQAGSPPRACCPRGHRRRPATPPGRRKRPKPRRRISSRTCREIWRWDDILEQWRARLAKRTSRKACRKRALFPSTVGAARPCRTEKLQRQSTILHHHFSRCTNYRLFDAAGFRNLNQDLRRGLQLCLATPRLRCLQPLHTTSLAGNAPKPEERDRKKGNR